MTNEHEVEEEYDESWATPEDLAFRDEMHYAALVMAGMEMSQAIKERRVPTVADAALSAIDGIMIIAAGAPEWFAEQLEILKRGHERCGCAEPMESHAESFFESMKEARSRGKDKLQADLEKATRTLAAYNLAAQMTAVVENELDGEEEE